MHLAGMPALEAEGYTAILAQWVRLELWSDEPLVTVDDKRAAGLTASGANFVTGRSKGVSVTSLAVKFISCHSMQYPAP